MKIVIACEQASLRQRLARLAAAGSVGTVSAVLAHPDEALVRQPKDPAEVIVLGVKTEADLRTAIALSEEHPAPAILFATVFADPMVARLEKAGVDYVLEHVQPRRYETALAHARPLTTGQALSLQRYGEPGERRHLLCRRRSGLGLIPVDDVRCFVADHKYVAVKHDEGEDLIEESLTKLEQEFGPRFLRVHRSALVARDALRGLEKDLDGRSHLLVDGSDTKLPVSRRRLPVVRRTLKEVARAG